ncbi:dephospho-CoA kinase [Clavibacter nebraskensis]|uniref:Dephospho-CoA kinase n=2 Tax=Clavibacter nebraskensis TaxID=31963 RepID=A0A399QMR1_9MICO|nr:dephospho-CoA kinase [Clavibacter nebraskensis]KXU20321.1 dephospho-CoA kinase [Clavibacter nebraskensis]OAH20689.1 dephospho-CoA kinase [Clavibacter nebraskensis]QGV66877.1 dephospho-CoA kinase [Clavibacter nebraskensis]QGV69678.1 dephospho-CoA kinase [Clavibacter nebraskensis]QGV72468.1 dephospho-CoA kinase [Clavibacter nebraskensis]
MQVIGLTGGIAAGKTVVADRLAELGAVRIDADRLAREVVEPGTPALVEIARRFGPGVIAPDGSLDRPALGAVVFQDPDARRDLEAITHPAVRALSAARMAAAGEADPAAVVVYDIPLLVESGRVDEFDRIVVVHAPREERIRRLVELRGMSPEEAGRRIASQATDEDRLAVADDVIDSGVSLASTLAQTDRLWANLPGGVGGRS